MAQVLDIGDLVDRQRLGSLTLKLLVLSFLAMVTDGYDILALAYAAPDIMHQWHVSRAEFGGVFSAGLVGILIGAPLLGHLGDRFGRKSAIIAGSVIYGVSTLVIVFAGSIAALTALRFIAGIGIGGVMPSTIAINAEFAPRRWRATLVILMFTGVTLGGALPGWIATELVPHFGWKVLFMIGGAAPLVIGLLLAGLMPESIKFLALAPERRERLAAVLRQLSPPVVLEQDTRIVTGTENGPAASSALLFAGTLRAVTPLLWLLFATNLMATYFLNSWMPTLFGLSGLSGGQSAQALSIFQIGGALGGIAISTLVDRLGLMPIIALFVLACPAVLALGAPGRSASDVMAAAGFAGFCVLGLQFGLNAISGIIYPTPVRAKGSGWAFAMGRFGSIIGPVAGGFLLSFHLPLQQLFYAPAGFLAVGAIAAIVTLVLCRKSLGSFRLGEFPAA